MLPSPNENPQPQSSKKPQLKLNIQTRKIIPKTQQPNPTQQQSPPSQISQPVSLQPNTSSTLTGSQFQGNCLSLPHKSVNEETCSQSPKTLGFRGQLFSSSSAFYKKYKIMEYIDGGTSAVVEKCVNLKTGEQYAVKRTKCQPQQILDIQKQFQTIKLLDHQNIIKYHSLYISPSQFKSCIVMQYFPYQPLSQHPQFSPNSASDIRHSWPSALSQSTHQPTHTVQKEQKLQKIMTQIFDALSYMHRIGVCHRDIKPENILYKDEENGNGGVVKIIDFGVSRDFGNGKIRKQMMTCTGTTQYKAMELFKGGFYDELIDEWAAGVTLYKLITGTTPFISPNLKTTIQNIEACTLDFPQQIWSSYNPFVKDLIRSLVCPRQQRITAEQAKNNLWFKNGNKTFSQSMKIKKINSLEEGEGLGLGSDKFTMTAVFGAGGGGNKGKEEQQEGDKNNKKSMLHKLNFMKGVEGVQQEVSDYEVSDQENN